MKKISNLGENLNRNEMKEVKGGVLAPEGFSTSCECVGAIGAWVANYPGGLLGAGAGSAADANEYCRTGTAKCSYRSNSISATWTVSTH
jgi:hypothetical protein